MRIPLEWLQQYIKINKKSEEIAESFTALGLMLDKPIEEFTQNKYKTHILDLEHRMDRSDWLSVIGCARDLAAFEKLELRLPELHIEKGKTPEKSQIVDIQVKCPDLVNRFNTRVFRNIKVKESPDWLKNRLEAYGLPSINNVVDITNYIMVELGQPMHAQDIDKMEKPEIVIRKGRNGEQLTTLLGETVKIDDECFVLTQNDKPTVLGGIVGGNATRVDETTTNIVLDAGNYNQNSVRKTSRRLKIQNETVQRYDKYLHPKLTEIAIARATKLILELAGGDYYENIDWYPKEFPEMELNFRMSRLKKLSGQDFETEKALKILTDLGYEILKTSDKSLSEEFRIKIPYFRTDVIVEDDLVSDILRINDYKNIPIALISSEPPKEITPDIYRFEEKLRDICLSLGLHEHITDPILGFSEKKYQIKLENSFSSEKNALRTSIYDTLFPLVETYKKHKKSEIGLFEIGKIYFHTGKGNDFGDFRDFEDFEEKRCLHVIYENENLSSYEQSEKLKEILSTIMQNLGIDSYYGERAGDEVEEKTTAHLYVGEMPVGIAMYNSFCLRTDKLLLLQKEDIRVKTKIPNYHIEDISLVFDLKKSFGTIYKEIREFSKDIVSVNVVETFTDEKLGKDKKSVLVRVTYKNTLDKEKLLSVLKKQHMVQIRE